MNPGRSRVEHHRCWSPRIVAAVLALLALSSIACHTFKPAGVAEPYRLEAVPSSRVLMKLVLSEPYATYVSRDMGHALADPQKYELGPALVALTRAHFGRAFALVPNAAPGAVSVPWEYAAEPKVHFFDNILSMDGPTQSIRIEVRARMRSRDDRALSEVWARGEDTHSIGALSVDVAETEKFLNDVLDATVARLAMIAAHEVARDRAVAAGAPEEVPTDAPACVPHCGRVAPQK